MTDQKDKRINKLYKSPMQNIKCDPYEIGTHLRAQNYRKELEYLIGAKITMICDKYKIYPVKNTIDKILFKGIRIIKIPERRKQFYQDMPIIIDHLWGNIDNEWKLRNDAPLNGNNLKIIGFIYPYERIKTKKGTNIGINILSITPIDKEINSNN